MAPSRDVQIAMMPWAHLAVGYVAYSLGLRATGRTPEERSTVALAVATQLPDLVDKPLDALLPFLEGRSFMHSLVFVIPLCVAALYVTDRRAPESRSLAVAFTIGVLTHLPGDAVRPFLQWGAYGAQFLLWPIYPAPFYPTSTLSGYLWVLRWHLEQLFAPEHVLSTVTSAPFLLVLTAGFLWASDGCPGLGVARRNWPSSTASGDD